MANMKKAWDLLSSLVPQFEALVLPYSVRTSNTEAHACMYIPQLFTLYNNVYRFKVLNTYP